MFSLEGVPAIYIHSLFGSSNDYDLFKITKQNRSLNRGKLKLVKLCKLIIQMNNMRFLMRLKNLMKIRKETACIQPKCCSIYTFSFRKKLYGIWRQSLDKTSKYFLYNKPQTHNDAVLSLLDLNLTSFDSWHDLLSDIKVLMRIPKIY